MWIIVPLIFIWFVGALILASFARWTVWWTFMAFMVAAAVAALGFGVEILPIQMALEMALYLVPVALVLGALIWAATRFETAFWRKKDHG